MSQDQGPRATISHRVFIPGNDVFNRAAIAMGLDDEIARKMLAGVLATRGVKPSAATNQVLLEALPQIDEQLALLVPPETRERVMDSLRKVLRLGGTPG